MSDKVSTPADASPLAGGFLLVLLCTMPPLCQQVNLYCSLLYCGGTKRISLLYEATDFHEACQAFHQIWLILASWIEKLLGRSGRSKCAFTHTSWSHNTSFAQETRLMILLSVHALEQPRPPGQNYSEYITEASSQCTHYAQSMQNPPALGSELTCRPAIQKPSLFCSFNSSVQAGMSVLFSPQMVGSCKVI